MPSGIGSDATFDIVLASDDESSPTTELGLTLYKSGDEPGWKELRLPPLEERHPTGPIGFASKRPGHDLFFSQSDWSGGALQALYNADEPNRYAQADGMEMRGTNVAALGMRQERRIDFLIRNANLESGVTTNWSSHANGSLSAISAAAKNGSYGLRFTVTSGTPGGNIVYQNLANATQYQGRTITLGVWAKDVDSTGNLYVFLDDDQTGHTNASSPLSSTYTYFTVTKTIHASASTVTVGIHKSTGTMTTNDDVDSDDWALVPAGGVIFHGSAELANSYYAAFGRVLCKWDESNDVWDAVKINSAAEFNAIEEFDGDIIATVGDGDVVYIWGKDTTWTDSLITGDGKYAKFLTVNRRNVWKSRKDGGGDHNFIASSTDIDNTGGAWSSEYSVGSSDREITGLFSIGDVLIVGKEDGAHVFNRVVNDFYAANTFWNLTNEYKFSPSITNFDKGAESKGWLYLVADQQTLLRFDGRASLQDISSLFWAPRLNFGGRIRALASDAGGLWLLLDTPTTDVTTTKDTWLMNLWEDAKGFHLHTLAQVRIGDIRGLAVNGFYLWAFGRIYNSATSDYEISIYRWNLPEKSRFAFTDDTPLINASGNFDTAIWDANLPSDDKAFIAITVWHKDNLDAEHTIIIKYGIDGEDSTDKTLTTMADADSFISTRYFDTVSNPETNAVGKAIQLNIALASDDTESPEIYAIALHAILRPARVRMLEFLVEVGGGAMLNNGLEDPRTKNAILTDLKTLEAQNYPIRLSFDSDGDGTLDEDKASWQFVQGSLERLPLTIEQEGTEVWKFLLQEVTTS